jgi:phage terminase large subunit-like protein
VSNTEFSVDLLPWQKECWDSPARFQVIAAGRRTGKSEYAAYRLLVAALQAKRGKTFYVAPTQQMARDVMWDKLHELGGDLIKGAHVNNLTITLVNGNVIYLKGADRPETLRGVSLNFLVLDEYATMKEDTWNLILRPACADLLAPVVMIGTPAGRNSFYELYTYAELSGDPDWEAFHYTSYDNPYISKEEIDTAKKTMASWAFRQEFEASFQAKGSEQFKEEWVHFNTEEPKGGEYYIAADLAGFEQTGKKRAKNRDNTAIAIVKVGEFEDEKGPYNWWVKDIIAGRWTLDETCRKLFSAVEFNQPAGFGIERGIAKQAVNDPLSNLMRKHNRFFRVEELTHGNQKKTDRVVWALQGRMENGAIRFNKGEWTTQFLDELFQFPDVLTHDDMVDALAYISQLAQQTYVADFEYDDYEPLDELSGY